MDKKTLIKNLAEVVDEYIATEEAYPDDVQLEINTKTWDTAIAPPEADLPDCDYYPLMDLVLMSGANPGEWEPDPVAIESVAAEYFPAG